MAITRDLVNQFRLTDWTPELLIVPNKFGVINESGLFSEDGVTQSTITFEEITKTGATVVDRVRGERNTVSSDATRKLRSFAIPHFPLDDYISPMDIQGQRAYGSPDGAEQLSLVRARKLERIALAHNQTMELARAQLLTAGTFYAPNGTVDNATTLWAEFGVTRKQVDFTLGTGTVDPISKIEEIIAYILDNAQGEVVSGFTAYSSPEFFAKLISHAKVVNAFQYYTSTQEPLRSRLGGDTSFRRTFYFGGITFVECRDTINGTRLIPANDIVVVPTGTSIFETVFAPANRFASVNTIGERMYMFEQADPSDSKIVLQSETNFLNFCKRPAMIVRGFSSN